MAATESALDVLEAPARRESVPAAAGRLASLDAFRGITIAGMILVNNPGTWSAVYAPLKHAEWHGWTPTDLIFPFFLFIVGVAITLALGGAASGHSERTLRVGGRGMYLKIFRRTLIIFGLGLFLNGFPYYDLATLRIPGVLQRIAVCYLVASLIFLKTTWRAQGIIGSALLVAYWALMKLVPVPGFGAGDLGTAGNLAAYVDRALLAGHIYRPLYDPEGILSTLPAIATTLSGVLAGHWLRSPRPPMEKVSGLFLAGAAAVVLGWTWNLWFPINKPLWSSSYVIFTTGLGLQLLACCYWLMDIHGYRRWAKPFVIFGVNALGVYVLSSLTARILSLIKFARPDGGTVDAKRWIVEHLFGWWTSPINASLLFALSYVLVWLGAMALLYRKRIFIKV